ncbi:hypothetical protein F4804DRAFT_73820 [Jackrogersella minutella]|nr:hypothetical protein F4804DRAFT_73820 [Jackrogersella minutella]
MEDGEDMNAAMAQAMGFSSFGAQNNPSKRRKFNPHADDAVVASSSTSTIPLHRNNATKEVQTGSNATPLGVRSRNEDEIDLEDDDEANAANGKIRNLKDGNADDPESRYLDTSRPPTTAISNSNDVVQSRIDTIVGVPSDQTMGAQSSTLSGGGDPSYRGSRGGRGGRGGYQANQGQRHESGKEWWEGYYDPSSNINPWAALDNAKGLEPKGSWMTWEEAKDADGSLRSRAGKSSLE